MKPNLPGSTLLRITAVVTLSSLIIFGTLTTVIQIDHEMLAAESIAQLGDPTQKEHYSHSVFLAQQNGEKCYGASKGTQAGPKPARIVHS
jgi:hypothetical protein